MSVVSLLNGSNGTDMALSQITSGRSAKEIQSGVASTDYRALHASSLWSGINQITALHPELKASIERAYHAAGNGELVGAAYGLSTSLQFNRSLSIDQRDAVFARITVLYIQALAKEGNRTPDGKTAMEYLQLHSCFLTPSEYREALSHIPVDVLTEDEQRNLSLLQSVAN